MKKEIIDISGDRKIILYMASNNILLETQDKESRVCVLLDHKKFRKFIKGANSIDRMFTRNLRKLKNE